MKFLKLIARYPFYSIIILFVAYYLFIQFSGLWNEYISNNCRIFLKFDSLGITHFFIPIFAALVLFVTFEQYTSYVKFDLQSRLVIAECEANEEMAEYFKENSDNLERINTEGKFLQFRDYHIDRFIIETKYKDIHECLEKRLNEVRSQLQLTIDLINNWLRIQRSAKIKNKDIEFLIEKIERLKEEQRDLMKLINEIREKHGFKLIPDFKF